MKTTPEEAKKLILAESSPDGLTVSGNLDLSGCSSLTALPHGLTVSGSFDLSGCAALTALPRGLIVSGYLDLSGCTSLTALPHGLTVSGELDLSGCTSLAALPDGLTVSGELVNFEEIPLLPKLDSAILAAIEAEPSSFDMSTWHSACGTTHCRAGHAVLAAGKVGSQLEEKFSTAFAAALLYLRAGKEVPDFHGTNEAALASIKAGAVKENEA